MAHPAIGDRLAGPVVVGVVAKLNRRPVGLVDLGQPPVGIVVVLRHLVHASWIVAGAGQVARQVVAVIRDLAIWVGLLGKTVGTVVGIAGRSGSRHQAGAVMVGIVGVGCG